MAKDTKTQFFVFFSHRTELFAKYSSKVFKFVTSCDTFTFSKLNLFKCPTSHHKLRLLFQNQKLSFLSLLKCFAVIVSTVRTSMILEAIRDENLIPWLILISWFHQIKVYVELRIVTFIIALCFINKLEHITKLRLAKFLCQNKVRLWT